MPNNPFITNVGEAKDDEDAMRRDRVRRMLIEEGMPENLAEILGKYEAEGGYWIGCVSYKHDVADLIAAYPMPPTTKEAVTKGAEAAAMMRGSLRVHRPDNIGVNLGRRALREIERYGKVRDKRPPTVVMPVVAELVRKVEVSRATFSLTLRPEGKSKPRVTIQGLSGQQILTYNHICGRAFELGLFCNTGKGAAAEWRKIMSKALPKAKVEDLSNSNEEATTILACRAVLRRILLSAERARTAGDLASGMVYAAPGRLAIAPDWAFQKVRRYLPDDKPTRQQIVEAAESLGVQTNFRPQLKGSRPRLWSFSVKVLAPGEGTFDE